MEHTTATVISVDSGYASLEAERPVCPRCRDGVGCGAGLLNPRGRPTTLRLPVPAGMSLATGDRVRIALEPGPLLGAVCLAYGLPLAGLLAGTASGAALAPGSADAPVLLGALLGLAAGAGAGRRLYRRAACPVPAITAVAGSPHPEPAQ